MTFPFNPAVTFITGLAITVASVFAMGLVPYTGVRITSRIFWIVRLLVSPKPVSASGVPIDAESARMATFIEESVVIVLPDYDTGSVPGGADRPDFAIVGAGSGADLEARLGASAAGSLERGK
ncbi:hypothetical protein [Nocardia callitridis]